jgi:hypothetical protein
MRDERRNQGRNFLAVLMSDQDTEQEESIRKKLLLELGNPSNFERRTINDVQHETNVLVIGSGYSAAR